MKIYPREERIDMIFTLGECHKNCLLASRVYAQKFPERNHPNPTVFKRFLHQFEETGSVNYKKPITRKSVTEDEENIFAFFENVLFSDKSTFHNNGLVNRHNFHYYSDTNPRAYRVMKNQNRWSVNVWGGILGQYLIGSYFFNQHVASIGWSSASLALRSSAIFKCQLSKQVDWQKWISGLNFTRFLFVGYIKGIVCHMLPTTSHDLKTRIRGAFKTVTPQMLSRVSSCFEKRIYKCLEMDGQHFEHLL
ncbi:hypothetical protein D910_00761 [Dendroctonus ponderosae]|uniref:DUF4817 domain-containing protein n=1 Tax=Dendroctonus ponderosae TaxID=77166 RepID=U4UPJ4_DENPD|nr:hypothetical protein D910_00761 [Dendroctonus ponderosae]